MSDDNNWQSAGILCDCMAVCVEFVPAVIEDEARLILFVSPSLLMYVCGCLSQWEDAPFVFSLTHSFISFTRRWLWGGCVALSLLSYQPMIITRVPFSLEFDTSLLVSSICLLFGRVGRETGLLSFIFRREIECWDSGFINGLGGEWGSISALSPLDSIRSSLWILATSPSSNLFIAPRDALPIDNIDTSTVFGCTDTHTHAQAMNPWATSSALDPWSWWWLKALADRDDDDESRLHCLPFQWWSFHLSEWVMMITCETQVPVNEPLSLPLALRFWVKHHQ